jgi:hypothetical protein
MLKLAMKFVGFALLMLALAIPSLAQNTKGDKPAPSRESRFKNPLKKSKGDKPGKRIKSRRKTDASQRAYIPRKQSKGGERAGKPIRPTYHDKTPSNKQKAWKGDIAGRRIRTKSKSSASSARTNVFPQSGRYVRRSPDQDNRIGRTQSYSRKISPQTSSGKMKKFYPQTGRYVNNSSRKPQVQKPQSNKATLARLKRLQSPERRPGRKERIVPRSASGSFIARKSINTWSHFPRPKRKQEKAYVKDIAGKPLRTKNYETQRPELISVPTKPRTKRRIGDQPYRGPASGRHVSATPSGQRAWRGDVTGRKIKGRNYMSKRGGEGKPVFPPKRKKYPSNAKGNWPLKGGGSRSGILWNNKGSAIPVRVPRGGDARPGTFQGTIKVGRQLSNQGEEFTGTVKTRRSAKGGGSRGGAWNNNGSAIPVRVPRGGDSRPGTFQGNIKVGRQLSNQGEEFTGSVKVKKRAKGGGGSISGKLWNNKQTPIPTSVLTRQGAKVGGIATALKRVPKELSNQGEEFTGSVKVKKRAKGAGGSISGKLWNNKQMPIPTLVLSRQASKVRGIAGSNKVVPRPIVNQGEEFTGFIKTKRAFKGGGSVSGKLWNNNESPIPVKSPSSGAQKAKGYTGTVKLNRFKKDYVKNPNASKEANLKKRPDKSTYQTGDLQVKVKQYNYIKNPSSAEDASKVREPGKAFARASDYQGNIKMQKFKLFEKKRDLHPDAKFVKINKNNVAEEKSMATNFKLWWARLFKKNDTLPDHIKEKERKPRYDKGEQGLWAD